jgi:hypothetical protein
MRTSGTPLGEEDDPRFRDPGAQEPIQSIATSRGRDDAGMFELQFRDERYLPFEGAGEDETASAEVISNLNQRRTAAVRGRWGRR